MAVDEEVEAFLDRQQRRRRDWDWFLQMLVRMANDSNAERLLNLTLLVGGTIVTGDLVGVQRYFDGIAEEMAASVDNEEYAAALRKFGELGQLSKAETQEPEPDDATEEELNQHELAGPHFIHLGDARIFHPGSVQVPGNRGVWWRGRLEAVDGFVFGRMTEPTKE